MLSNLKEMIKNFSKHYFLSSIVGGVVCLFFVNFAGWLYINFNNNYLSFFAPVFFILSIIIPFIKEDLKIKHRIRKFIFWNVAITIITLSILWFFNLFNSVSPDQPPSTLIEEMTSFFGVGIVLQISLIPSIMLFHRLKK